jgi:hypothetical protein
MQGRNVLKQRAKSAPGSGNPWHFLETAKMCKEVTNGAGV